MSKPATFQDSNSKRSGRTSSKPVHLILSKHVCVMLCDQVGHSLKEKHKKLKRGEIRAALTDDIGIIHGAAWCPDASQCVALQ